MSMPFRFLYENTDLKHASVSIKIVLFALLIAGFIFTAIWCCICCRITNQVNSNAAAAALTSVATASTVSRPYNAAEGLDHQLLASLPTFIYSAGDNKVMEGCPVCLMDFNDGDEGRFLPGCLHRFHAECVDLWFLSHNSCPVCRSTVKVESFELPV